MLDAKKKTRGPALPLRIAPSPPLMNVSSVARFVALPSRFEDYIRDVQTYI
jgi:hypothetical protein